MYFTGGKGRKEGSQCQGQPVSRENQIKDQSQKTREQLPAMRGKETREKSTQ